jgi:hypothetical protein
MIVAVHDAGPFAEHLYRASLGTTAAKNVGIKDAERGAAKVSRADALNESGHIDMRWTRSRARRVKTIQATIRFDDGSLRRKRWFDLSKTLSQQKIVWYGCGTHRTSEKLSYSLRPL